MASQPFSETLAGTMNLTKQNNGNVAFVQFFFSQNEKDEDVHKENVSNVFWYFLRFCQYFLIRDCTTNNYS